MIANNFQGKGYGERAMHEVIKMISAKPDCERIRLSVVPENAVSIEFYKRLGFVVTMRCLRMKGLWIILWSDECLLEAQGRGVQYE